MLPYSIAPTPGPSREVSARPRDAADQAPPPAPARLGYRFDPAPEALHDQVRAGWLRPIDVTVLVEMIRWGRRRGHRDSCWCSRQVVARAIGRTPRTVQSSWGRLRSRGFLESAPVGPSDPDDPANRTGWRHHFAWLTRGLPAPGPAEAPPPRRPRGRPRRATPEGGGEKFISPPPEKFISPKGSEEILKQDEETLNVTADAGAGNPTATVAPMAGGEIPREAVPPDRSGVDAAPASGPSATPGPEVIGTGDGRAEDPVPVVHADDPGPASPDESPAVAAPVAGRAAGLGSAWARIRAKLDGPAGGATAGGPAGGPAGPEEERARPGRAAGGDFRGGPGVGRGGEAAGEVAPAGPARGGEAPGSAARAVAAGPVAAGPPTPAWSEAERAEELVRMVRSRGVDLRVVPDPDRGEVIVPVRLSASARELEPGVVDRLKRLRPWVLAYLEGGGRPVPPASGAAIAERPAGPKAAPPVSRAARAEVRARIGRLAVEPGAAAVDGVVEALARALGDDGPESRRLYRGLAAEVQTGTRPMDLLIGAFEWGCGRGARHRGRLFTGGVKDWLRRNGRGHPPG